MGVASRPPNFGTPTYAYRVWLALNDKIWYDNTKIHVGKGMFLGSQPRLHP